MEAEIPQTPQLAQPAGQTSQISQISQTAQVPIVPRKRRPRELRNLGLPISDMERKGKKSHMKGGQVNMQMPEQKQVTPFNMFLHNQKAHRLMSFRPNTRRMDLDSNNLPKEVESISKLGENYKRLVDLEEDLDKSIYRKRAYLNEYIMQPSTSSKVKAQLALHIFNKHYNQDNPFTFTSLSMKVPSWRLFIQGKVIVPSLTHPNGMQIDNESYLSGITKLSRFIKKIKVWFKCTENEHITEILWGDEHAHISDVDGFEISREGTHPIDINIQIHFKYSPVQYKVGEGLSSLLGIKNGNRAKVMRAFWEYIKANRLQDSENRMIINCNKELREIFGTDRFEFSSVLTRLKQHLGDPDPLNITYTLNLTMEQLNEEKLFHIPVEIDDPEYLNTLDFVVKNPYDPLIEEPQNKPGISSIYKKKIAKYNKKITHYINCLKHSLHKRNFFLCYSEESLKFLQNYLLQQNSLLQSLKDENKISIPEEYNYSYFYPAHEDEIEDAISMYFNQKNLDKLHEEEGTIEDIDEDDDESKQS